MIDPKLLKQTIEDAKAVRNTKLATCTCGHCSSSKYEPLSEEEFKKQLDEVMESLEKELEK